MVTRWMLLTLAICLFVTVAKSEEQKRSVSNEGHEKRLFTSLRSELENLRRRVLEDLDKRNQEARKGIYQATREASKRDFESIEATGSKRDTITRDVGEKAKNQRDFEGIEQKIRDTKASRDFEGIEQLRNAKDVRDFEGIEQKLRNSKDVRDFEGIEQLRNAKDVRDFEGIEQKLRGAKVLRDFEGIEQRMPDKIKKKRKEEAQKARSLRDGRGLEEYLMKRVPSLQRRAPYIRDAERRSPDVYWDSSELQKRERFLGRRAEYDDASL